MILEGDCVEKMRELDEASVDAIVTDPPYGMRFMGKAWDGAAIEREIAAKHESEQRKPRTDGRTAPHDSGARQAGTYDLSPTGNRAFQSWCEGWATEALRVLKPGGHLLAFGGTRTYHRLACAVEDAGFEIRDSLLWLYGSGFPKSLDVSKAIDKAAGAEREIIETIPDRWAGKGDVLQRATQDERDEAHITAPATPEAAQWQGWGTALKPSHEPIVMARKPLTGTVAANVQQHGTGALNVDGCRVGAGQRFNPPTHKGQTVALGSFENCDGEGSEVDGRWPSNVVLSPEAAEALDEQSGERGSPGGPGKQEEYEGGFGGWAGKQQGPLYLNESGGASRFFYTAKASRAERNAGLDGLPEVTKGSNFGNDGPRPHTADDYEYEAATRNTHPTVKPIDLMRWLVRLVTPLGGTVLDPFAGSGTTGIAAVLEGFDFLGIEREAEYAEIARARIDWWEQQEGDTADILVRAGLSERMEREHVERGQLGLLDG